jgi:hypothetical protein
MAPGGSRSRSLTTAAIAASALAALVLAVVAAGSTSLVAASLLGRLARLGAGYPDRARRGPRPRGPAGRRPRSRGAHSG